MTVAQAAVLRLYDDGVDAIARYAGQLRDAAQWQAIACGDWNAAEVVAHVEYVVGWYHQWLDRAELGDASPAFAIDELPARNQAELDEGGADDPARHVDAFVGSARAYAQRLPAAWDLPFGYPRGTVTAGQHAALAAVEWHAHAWDLARVIGIEHVPSDANVLAEAAAETWFAAQGQGPVARATAAIAPKVAKRQRDPWAALLRRLGRA